MSINILNYGADPTGATDSLAAFNAAEADVPSSGGDIIVPSGCYSLSGAFTKSKPGQICGDGRDATTLQTTSPTADLLYITSQYVTVADMKFTSSVPRTGGAYVNLASTAHRFHMEDYHMEGAFIGFQHNGSSTVDLVSGLVLNGVLGSSVGFLFNGGFDLRMHDLTMDNSGQIASAIRVTSCGDLSLSDLDLAHCGLCLHLVPTGGHEVDSVSAVNCDFDNSTVGLMADATSGGHIFDAEFTRCWFSSASQQGVAIKAGGGTIDGMTFDQPQILLNQQDGMLLLDNNINRVSVNLATIAGNGMSGFGLGGQATNWKLLNSHIGSSTRWPGNKYGVWAGGPSYHIAGNTIRGNVAGGLVNGVNDGSSRFMANNAT